MTDRTHLDDVEFSALIDGDASSVVQAHLEGCAACQRELESWRRAIAMVGVPPAVPAGGLDAAVAAAVSSADDAAIIPLAGHRRRTPAWLRARAIGAAAAVVLVGGIVGGVVGTSGGGTQSASNSVSGSRLAPIPATTTAPKAAASRSPVANSSGGSGAAATPSDRSLGSLETVAAVAAAVRSSLSHSVAGSFSSAPQAAPASGCVAKLAQHLGVPVAKETFAATLQYQGSPAVVFVFFNQQGARVGVLARTASCESISTFNV